MVITSSVQRMLNFKYFKEGLEVHRWLRIPQVVQRRMCFKIINTNRRAWKPQLVGMSHLFRDGIVLWKCPQTRRLEGHVKKSGTNFLKICCTHVPTSWRHVRNICPSSAKSICYFSVCHWVVSQGSGCSGHSAYLSISQHTGRTREGRGAKLNSFFRVS